MCSAGFSFTELHSFLQPEHLEPQGITEFFKIAGKGLYRHTRKSHLETSTLNNLPWAIDFST